MSYKFGCGEIKASQIASMMDADVRFFNCTDIGVTGAETDSRKIEQGDLFVAVKGEFADGADYAASAVLSGATCILSDRLPDHALELNKSYAYIHSDDPLESLRRFAKKYKNGLKVKTVAVTGSVGKTTTKEMISSVLSRKYAVEKTPGNRNTDIGLSLTLLGFSERSEIAVLEMGMSNFGEISVLSKIANPDVGVITNIGTSHIEFLGSRENIAKAKSEITDGMNENGVLVVNGDEPLLENVGKDKGIRRRSISVYSGDSEYRAENIRFYNMHTLFDIKANDRRICDIDLPVLGTHHVYGALFAFAVGEIFGVGEDDIRAGLACFSNVDMRQTIKNIGGVTVIDASYNASPESMRASLDVLCELAEEKKGRKIALLGDMRELGAYARSEHEKVGAYVAKLKIDKLVTFGVAAVCIAEAAKAEGMPEEDIISELNIQDYEKCAEDLLGILQSGDTLLVKASRAVAAEKITEYIGKRLGN